MGGCSQLTKATRAGGEDVDGGDDDAEMPTQGEILATAARIFGGAPAGAKRVQDGG